MGDQCCTSCNVLFFYCAFLVIFTISLSILPRKLYQKVIEYYASEETFLTQRRSNFSIIHFFMTGKDLYDMTPVFYVLSSCFLSYTRRFPGNSWLMLSIKEGQRLKILFSLTSCFFNKRNKKKCVDDVS